MFEATSFGVFYLLLFLPLVLFAIRAAKSFLIPRTRTYKHVEGVRRLLNPSNVPLERLLLARAAPNQRLVHAFGLTNTFVSGDVKVHKAFTSSAKALIAAGSAGEKEAAWRAVASCTEATVRQHLGQDNVVAFSTFAQCIVFVVVLSVLFDTDVDAVRYEDIVQVTQAINQRWEDSKTKTAASMRDDKKDDSSLATMRALIEQWVVDRERFPNPLDYILPAYETMWRVVAVTVARVHGCPDGTLYKTAAAFAREPTQTRFEAFGEEKQPSMEAIVLEVLRLHPPTRHIARAPNVESAGSSWWTRWYALVSPAVEIADVEAIQLSESEYGTDASMFDPMRFHPSRMREGQERQELYSFGHGRLRCVAAAWAPMAAGVIAAKVIEQLDEAGLSVKMGPKIGGRKGWDQWEVVRGGEKKASA